MTELQAHFNNINDDNAEHKIAQVHPISTVHPLARRGHIKYLRKHVMQTLDNMDYFKSAEEKDAWKTKSIINKIKIWFMPTGWRPDDVKNINPLLEVKHPNEQIKYGKTFLRGSPF